MKAPWPLYSCHTHANNGKGAQWEPWLLHACCAAVLCMLCCCAVHAVLLCYACRAAVLCMPCIAGMQKDLPPVARHLPGRWLHQWAEGTGHTAAQTSPDVCCDPNAVMLDSSTVHSCCLLPACQDNHLPLAEFARLPSCACTCA